MKRFCYLSLVLIIIYKCIVQDSVSAEPEVINTEFQVYTPNNKQEIAGNESYSQNVETYFDYERFENLRNLISQAANKENLRLCALDKVCMDMWRKRKLEISKNGHMIEGNFNEDEKKELAFVLEEDSLVDESKKNFYLCVYSDDPQKLLMYEKLPEIKSVVDLYFDLDKKAIVIDTGERIKHITTISSLDGSNSSVNAIGGRFEKILVEIVWNKELNMFVKLEQTKSKSKSKKKH